MLPNNQIDFLYTALGERIREVRTEAKMSQIKLADLLMLSRASLVNIEKGRQKTPLHVIYDIARILNVDISEILPQKEDLNERDFKSNILNKIKESSGGNLDLEEKLMGFVKTSKSSYE